MNSDESSPSPWTQFFTWLLIFTGLLLAIRLGWNAFEGRRRGRVMTSEEFHDAVKGQLARDRANFERDWIASGKPIPRGGFDTLFKHPSPEDLPSEGGPPPAPQGTP